MDLTAPKVPPPNGPWNDSIVQKSYWNPISVNVSSTTRLGGLDRNKQNRKPQRDTR